MGRADDIETLYRLLDRLERRVGGRRRLTDCTGRQDWPERGVYFFFEDGETRASGAPRVVRVGTHALKPGSTSTLWGRLRQHRGTVAGGRVGGDHRGSVFRRHLGGAMLARGLHPEAAATWAAGSSAPRAARDREAPLEAAVSRTVGAMSVLWAAVDDEPGPQSLRGVIESNTIGLLSNAERAPIDPPSAGWLGHSAPSERVRASGLWNSNHVREPHDPTFLDVLSQAVERTRPRPEAPGAR